MKRNIRAHWVRALEYSGIFDVYGLGIAYLFWQALAGVFLVGTGGGAREPHTPIIPDEVAPSILNSAPETKPDSSLPR